MTTINSMELDHLLYQTLHLIRCLGYEVTFKGSLALDSTTTLYVIDGAYKPDLEAANKLRDELKSKLEDFNIPK